MTHPFHLFLTLAIIAGGVFGIHYTLYAYPEVFKSEVNLIRGENIDCAENIIVNFSHPVAVDKYVGVRLSPEIGVKLTWENSNKQLVISPVEFWQPETNYTLYLPEGRSSLFTKIEPESFTFSTVKLPKVKSFSPEKGEKNVSVGMEDPIVINFSTPTAGFFIKFTIDPFVDMAYQNNTERTQFKLIPKEKLKEGTDYKIKIYAKYNKDRDDGYREIYFSNFETVPPPPSSWEKDFALRLEQARKFTQAKIQEGKYIDINLTSQIISTFENGKLLSASLISSGKKGMDTPKGTYEIMAKRPRPWSKKYALYMPWFMQFTGQGHGLHELPEWPGGYKEGANHLGIPVSHGCVRLGIGPAKALYDWAEVGTPIVIY